MFRINGRGSNQTCQGVSRRELLQVGAIGGLGLSLADLFRPRLAHAASSPPKEINCIFLFLWGGPPQHELWDPKPDAPSDIAGPVKPIETSVSGIRIGEMLPRMAQLAQHYTLIRSAHHEIDIHGHSAHYTQTGMPKSLAFENPNMGAVVDRFLGPRGAMPAFVTVGPYMLDSPVPNTGQDGGFLGNSHQPFRIADPQAPLHQQPSLSPAPGITVDRLLRRDQLLTGVDRFQRQVETDAMRGYDTAHARAVSLTTSASAKAAFDLSKEPAKVRERYDTTPFGQGCLLARRLIEGGVRYVQVNWTCYPVDNGGFDNHESNLPRLKNQLPILDRACSALIEDLVQRGLWDTTLLIVTGEFGRTPKINPSAGRDHWPYVYSYLIGGGGIPGGRVIGASDVDGAYPATTPITPEMRTASIFSHLGLDVNVKLRADNLISDSRGIPGLFGES
jgi:uncharacterized protein (DUF1501 family)